MFWQREKTLKFIECYKSHTLLWDSKHEFHMHKSKRIDAWEEIAAKFGKRPIDVKTKFRHLRSHLLREQRKIHSGEIDHSNWFAYKSLAFLLSTTNTHSKIRTKKKVQEETTKQTSNVEESPSGKSQNGQDAHPNDNTSAAVIKEVCQWLKKRDEFDLFGAQIAIKLRNIQSSYTRVSIQNKMNNLFVEADMGMCEEEILHQNDPSPSRLTVTDVFMLSE